MPQEMFHRSLAEREIARLKKAVFKQALGSYTKAYETGKRIHNVVKSFFDEIKNIDADDINVLDLGCGDGYHLLLMSHSENVRNKKISFEGVDLSEVNVLLATEIAQGLDLDNMNFRQGNIEEIKSKEAAYQVVLCTDVVEHLEKPEDFLAHIFQSLRPGGLLILTTPNDNNATVVIYNALRGRKKEIHEHHDNHDKALVEGHGHISVKDLKEWIVVFEQAGFKVEKIKRSCFVFGGSRYNSHPILFAFVIILDKIFDVLPFMKNFSEAHTYLLRRPL